MASRPASSRLRIVSIDDSADARFGAAFRLYRSAFPPSERIGRAYFEQLFAEKRLDLLSPFNFHFLVAVLGERVAGFISGTYLAIANVGFVGYLAVEPQTKGRSVGSRLRKRFVELVRRDARAAGYGDALGVVGEVEVDNRWLSHLRSKGALALDFDYYQPAIDGANVVPLVLYLEPFGRGVRSVPTLTLRRLLYALYRRLYRVRFPLADPQFRRMLRQLEGRVRVGSRTLPPPR